MLCSWSCTLSVLYFLGSVSVISANPAPRAYATHNYYVLEYNKREASASLDGVARELGVEVVERAGELPDHYLVRSLKPAGGLFARDEDHDPVLARYGALRARSSDSDPASLVRRDAESTVARSILSLERQTLRKRYKRAPPPLEEESISAVAYRMHIQDPLFEQQWHIVNEEYPEHSMNVVPVWDMGYTGKGIISSLIDDGLDYNADDLKDAFDAADSHDFNDHVALPTPKGPADHHGTRCAGQIAARRNHACGVGIAFNSKVAGVRILSGHITDVDEAAALNYGYQNVSLYSCSWGPPDNGRSMDAPNHLIRKAVINGINYGRGGKGSIFVFASGNGAHHGDQCNFDGYTNSIYSVTVGAVDHRGQRPFYSEACAANLVVAYSSGDGQHIVTTDLGKDSCSYRHGGTSAAAPNVVAVFALALEARPDLTWRDIQYLCIETAKHVNPSDPDWDTTAVGRPYSNNYGYGVIDAELFVRAALKWKLVKPQARMLTESIQLDGGKMSVGNKFSGGTPIGPGGVTSVMTITQDMKDRHNLGVLEHVNVKVWIEHDRRGDVEVEITSPKGVTSVLGEKRSGDDSKKGYPGWMFMTVKHWGEDGVGDWTIRVSDQGRKNTHGKFIGWNMVLWGVAVNESEARLYEALPDDEYFPPLHRILPTHPLHSLPSDIAEATFQLPPEIAQAIDYVAGRKLIFGVVFAAFVALICGLVYRYRKAQRLELEEYTSLPPGEGDALMRSVRESALGPIAPGPVSRAAGPAGAASASAQRDDVLGFHSGFLDDSDDEGTPAAPPPRYRDEPEEPVRDTPHAS